MENDKAENTETSWLDYAATSNKLPSDQYKCKELTKAFEKSLEGLENLVKLFKSDVNKMFNISDSSTSLDK